MVFFSSSTSPRASTVIFCDRSPLATAVVTRAMLRTWLVRLPASRFTLSVRSFQVPDTPLTSACPPSLPSVPTSLRDAGDLGGEGAQLIDHRVDGVLQLEDLALGVDGDLLREVAVGDRGGDRGDVAHLGGQVAGQQVDVVGEVLPGAGDARHLGLAAQLAFDADLARHGDHLLGEDAERVGHAVDGVGQRGDLALGRHGELLRQVAVGDRGDDLDDAAHLVGQVARPSG